MEALREYEIVVGTYEENLLGFLPMKDATLAASFTDHAHSGAIRCLSAAGKYLVSGAADETMKILNLRKRATHGSLHHHDDTVNAAVFYDAAHLVTAAEDGKICILRTKDWLVEKTLVKHTGGVTCIAVHPSGKLALSAGKDRKLVTWNLVKGRSAYITNIKEVADFIRWSPDGSRYVVGFYKHADVYSTAQATVTLSIRLPGRANAAEFLDEDTMLLAGEMPEIEAYCLKSNQLLSKFEAHERRVRCTYLTTKEEGDRRTLVTASNDGLIKVWSLQRDSSKGVTAQKVCEHDTKCRITCMVVHKVPETKVTAPKKRKMCTEEKEHVVELEAEEVVEEKTDLRTMNEKMVELVEEVENDDDGPEQKKKRQRKKKKKKPAI